MPKYRPPNSPEDMDDWGCQMWIDYHKLIKSVEGQQVANDTIRTDVGRTGSFADVNWCKYDCQFMQYFYNEGVEGGNIFSKLYCNLEKVSDGVGETVAEAGQLAGTLSRNISKSAQFLLSPYVLIPTGAYIAYKIYQDYEKRKK